MIFCQNKSAFCIHISCKSFSQFFVSNFFFMNFNLKHFCSKLTQKPNKSPTYGYSDFFARAYYTLWHFGVRALGRLPAYFECYSFSTTHVKDFGFLLQFCGLILGKMNFASGFSGNFHILLCQLHQSIVFSASIFKP